MIWLIQSDFDKQIKTDMLSRIIESNAAILDDSERAALAEVQAYLRSNYDVPAIFSTSGTARDAYILMITIDVLLYHVHSRNNPNQIPDIRRERYLEAKRTLEDIAKGVIDLGLPRSVDEDGDQITRIRYSSDGRRNY